VYHRTPFEKPSQANSPSQHAKYDILRSFKFALFWGVACAGILFFVLHVVGLFTYIDLSYSTSFGIDRLALHNDFRKLCVAIDVPLIPQRNVVRGWRLEVKPVTDPPKAVYSWIADVWSGRSVDWVSTSSGFRGGSFNLILAHPIIYSPCFMSLFWLLLRHRAIGNSEVAQGVRTRRE